MAQLLTSIGRDSQQSEKRLASLQADYEQQLKNKETAMNELRKRITVL